MVLGILLLLLRIKPLPVAISVAKAAPGGRLSALLLAVLVLVGVVRLPASREVP